MSKILQIVGILFIVVVVGGVILFVLAKKEIQSAEAECTKIARSNLQEKINKGSKDQKGRVWLDQFSSFTELINQSGEVYNECMRKKGVPEMFLNSKKVSEDDLKSFAPSPVQLVTPAPLSQ